MRTETWVQEAGGRAECSHLIFGAGEGVDADADAGADEGGSKEATAMPSVYYEYLAFALLLLAWLVIKWTRNSTQVQK